MIENNMYCLEHFENRILNVCIANHQCQRKLCYECAHNQQVSSELLIPISNFPDFILEKFFNLSKAAKEQTFELKTKFISFQKQLEMLGEQFQKCLVDSLTSIKEILIEIDKGDQNYQRLLNFYCKPTEISQIDLELIISAIYKKKLEKWNIDKESIIIPIIEMKSSLESQLRDFQTNIFQQLKVLNQLNGQIKENKNKNWQEGKIETIGMQINFNLYFLDPQFQKTPFTVEYNNNEEIIYIQDGVKLKIEKRKNTLKSYNFIRNLDQLRCLEWSQRSNNYLKSEKWMAIYRGEYFESGGRVNMEGLKIGQWIDLFENFSRSSLTFYKGVYNYGKKVGIWDILSNDRTIGCGVYDDNGIKNGLWVDLHENFFNDCEVLYMGQYQNGQKIGKWETFYKNQIIGGGVYNSKGAKVGKWIILHENFQELHILENIKEENLEDGTLSIKMKSCKNLNPNNIISGGGIYDRKGLKNGRWIDVHENFLDYCYILYEGDYVAGKKQGLWTVFMKENEIQTKIGEGYFNKFGLKHGKWVEPFRNFFKGGKIIFIGEYENNIKIGKWVTYFQGPEEHDFQQIGSGSYDQNGQKEGVWKELYENFTIRSQIMYEGEYKIGQKHLRWNILYKEFQDQEFQQIGGGEYDDDGMKHGQWIDFIEDFSSHDCLFSVEYHHGEMNQYQSISKGATQYNII